MTAIRTTVLTFTILAGLSLLCVAKPASAQLPGVGLPGGVSIGAFFPTNSDLQKHGGTTQYDIEGRYALPGIPFTGIKTIATIGLETGASNDEHSTIVPLTIGLYAGGGGISPLRAKNVYFGGGLGEYFITQSKISSKTSTGVFAALGYNLPAGLFTEAKYQFVSGGNGATLSVGIRF